MNEASISINQPGTIFSQRWWLDAVAPAHWDEIIVEKGGQIVARLPYVVQRKHGMTVLAMPPLTQTLGPWLRPYPGKYSSRLADEKQVMTELIEKLPKFEQFTQSFHYSITNWLPFYWQGFQQTTRYTYVIEGLSELETLWREAHQSSRRAIRKAQKQLIVRSDLPLDTFLDINEMTFMRQGMSLPYSRDLVARLDHACGERNCRKMFFAEDAQKRIHAALYLVWDDNAAYYLMGGADPELRKSGASSMLMWEAIQHAASVTRTFDFEGSMSEPIERFFRSFGARQKPYFRISKTNALSLKMRQDVKSWWRMLRGS